MAKCGSRNHIHLADEQIEVPNVVTTRNASRQHMRMLQQKQQEQTMRQIQKNRGIPTEDTNRRHYTKNEQANLETILEEKICDNSKSGQSLTNNNTIVRKMLEPYLGI